MRRASVFAWLRRFGSASRRRAQPQVLLNEGLALAMDWGQDWLAPIQDRLRWRHPCLLAKELDELNATCQQVMQLGHESAYALVRSKGQDFQQDDFAAVVLAQYPWVNGENVARLFKQSIYYAWKTGGPPGSG